jgi:hypothetical protein
MGRLPAIAGVALGLGVLSVIGVALVGLNYYDEGATTPWWFDAWGALTWFLLGAGVIGLLATVAVVVREAVRRW